MHCSYNIDVRLLIHEIILFVLKKNSHACPAFQQISVLIFYLLCEGVLPLRKKSAHSQNAELERNDQGKEKLMKRGKGRKKMAPSIRIIKENRCINQCIHTNAGKLETGEIKE